MRSSRHGYSSSSSVVRQCGKLERRSRRWSVTFGLLLAGCLIAVAETREQSLYKPEDGLLEVDVNTFESSIYNQPTAFIVEFYSSWCGHCVDYAPHYVKFAKLLRPWRSIVVPAVINCADEMNAPTCRHHAIDAFPTLKYFRVGALSKIDSMTYTEDKKDFAEFGAFIAERILRDFNALRPIGWPSYRVLPDSQSSLSEVWSASDGQVSLLCLVVEEEPNQHGFALLTNYVEDRRVRVIAVQPTHPLAHRFGGVKMPAIYIFSRRNPELAIYSSNTAMTWINMTTQVDLLLALEPPAPAQQIRQPLSADKQTQERGIVEPPPTDTEAAAAWPQHRVELLDLQKTLLYLLNVEVPRNARIRGVELSALRGWVTLLRHYAPGTTPMRRMFYRLDEWLKLAAASGELTADDWLGAVERIQEELGRPLPVHDEYLSCRGSEPKFRGYTCGLWTLFHSITVQAYKESKDDANFKPYEDVLEPIHQFIVQFLSCEMCAKHFDQMTRDRQMKAVNRPEDVVLWLWSAHNSVNRRLSGDATDDPKYPKHQFPPPAICAACRRAGDEFDESAVLNFLLTYYADIKLDGIANMPEYQMKKFENGKLDAVANRRLNPKFMPMAGKVDNLEEVETRLHAIRQEMGPKHEWKSIGDNDFNGPPTADRKTFYLLWLLVAGFLLAMAYYKYRQNRSKFWKALYYYNNYKLIFWRRRPSINSQRRFAV